MASTRRRATLFVKVGTEKEEEKNGAKCPKPYRIISSL